MITISPIRKTTGPRGFPRAVIVLVLLAGAVLAGCSAGGAKLAGTSWSLVSYGPSANQTAAAPEIETSLVFDADEVVSGNMGCNSFSGSYTQKDGKIIFDAMASTLMACDELRSGQEAGVLAVLTGEATYMYDNDRLTITAGDQSAVFAAR